MRIVIVGMQSVFREGLISILKNLDGHGGGVSFVEEREFFARKTSFDVGDVFIFDAGNGQNIVESGLDVLARELVQNNKRVVFFVSSITPFKVRDFISNIGVSGVVPKDLDASLVDSAMRLVCMGGRYVPEMALQSEMDGFAEPSSSLRYHLDGRNNGGSSSRPDYLTPRQLQVWVKLGKGFSNQKIADALGISIATVKLHVNAILQTLGVTNRTEAAILALKRIEEEAFADDNNLLNTKTDGVIKANPPSCGEDNAIKEGENDDKKELYRVFR